MRRDVITDLLDVAGVGLVAAGVAAAFYVIIGWACLIAAGIVVLLGSSLSTWMLNRDRRRVQ